MKPRKISSNNVKKGYSDELAKRINLQINESK